MDRRNVTLVWLYLTGVLATAQLGKMPALMPAISRELAIGLVLGSVLISLVEFGGALFATAAEGVVRVQTHRRALKAGLLLFVAGSLLAAVSTNATVLFAARILDGLGYLGIVISAPVLMAHSVSVERRPLALAVWSTFFPVGFTLGAVVAGPLADLLTWRVGLGLWAGVALVLVVMPPPLPVIEAVARERSDGHRSDRLRPWIFAGGFGLYTAFMVGMLALAPEFFVTEFGMTLSAAGLATGLAAFVNAAGLIVPLLLARYGLASTGWQTGVLLGALTVPAVLLVFVFSGALAATPAVCLFVALNALSGVFPSMAFSLLPKIATASDLSRVNALIAHTGASGSLAGPPLFALFVVHGGWAAAAWCGIGLVCASAAAMLSALRTVEQRHRTDVADERRRQD